MKLTYEGTRVRARRQTTKYGFEATFTKVEDAWGASWKSDGPLKQWRLPLPKSSAPVAADAAAVAPPAAPVAAPAAQLSARLLRRPMGQSYLKYKVNDVISVDLGQFDTIFGVELNDSKDRIFNKTGILYDAMIPVTHTGIMLESNANGFSQKIFAANPNNQGSYGNKVNSGTNTEYGAAVGDANASVHTQVGYMTRSVARADMSARAQRTLLDVVLGGSVGCLSGDVEFTALDDPNKNTLTPNNASDHETAATGVLSLISYKFNDLFLVSVRYERLGGDPSQAGFRTIEEFGLSAHYKLAPELELRAEVMDAHWKSETNTINGNRFGLSAMISF